MINLIMGGFPDHYDHWKPFSQNNGEFSFLLSRMFENTSDGIRKKLSPLSSNVLSYLEKLPTIFMSEAYQIEGAKPYYVDIRIGRISNIHIKGKEINFQFAITHTHNKIKISDAKSVESSLELGTYGLKRTHWAIKDKNIDDILKTFGINQNAQVDSSPAPLPDEDSTLLTVNSLQEFIEKVLHITADMDEEIFYRGHSDSSYELAPSLFRKYENGNYKFLHNEINLVKEALSARPSEFIDDTSMLDKLVRMQHYGIPTRLLDITSNPLIALYFACSSINSDKNDIDGQVIIFKTHRENIKFFDSDTVSCISNLCMLSKDMKDKLSFEERNNDFNSSHACLKLLESIKHEKPYFKSMINPEDLEKIIFVKSRINNERISSQSGAFLLFGNNAVFPEISNDQADNSPYNFKTEKINIRDKKKILKELAVLNITDATVYLGLERTMKLITEKYTLKN
ncbi:TPA: FRG domain-containing protein [Escherichia coli]|uniref:FRG domain-containing protein n=1 Tax=Escherichia coli TaxID=562 RepID=UPI001CBF48B3|nr:FRG domain-containing protein [Escherichia coli]MED8590761.1 FRG domain-containing protein [Escherichia coli]HDQ0364968.1 FRG domain-containing protein [Escherichia coli]HDX7072074.1 FRG domain-containing protein [Escherichia coli]